jgi:hypothetical protein
MNIYIPNIAVWCTNLYQELRTVQIKEEKPLPHISVIPTVFGYFSGNCKYIFQAVNFNC